jgi:hypothetical protein
MRDKDKMFRVPCEKCGHEVGVDLSRDAPDVEDAVDAFFGILKMWAEDGPTEDLDTEMNRCYEIFHAMAR